MSSSKNPIYDVIILGAGAAGLMCAIEAGRRARSVLVIEHNDKLGKKIRISGGGRCNFTNIHAASGNYLSHNEHFAKSALARFSPQDFLALVKKHKIRYHEKKLGQLFCDDSAQEIIDMLVNECRANNAEILLNTKVISVEKKERFLLKAGAKTFQGKSLVVATGGLSIPPLGVSDLGYRIAKQFHLKIQPTLPGLVPLVLAKGERELFQEISGVSLPVRVSCRGVRPYAPTVIFEENILFTHRGLSGPAILQISSYWRPKEALTLDLLPGNDCLTQLKKARAGKILMSNFLSQFFPKRFAHIFALHYLKDRPLKQYSDKDLARAAELIHAWKLTPEECEGYAKAEVTLGGVDTDELSSKTMEAKKVPGLYFIGEVVDVTGHLGGFNFQWAWASGYCAGQYV